MRNILSNMSLFKKTALLCIFCITLPAIIFAGFLYETQFHQLYKQAQHNDELALSQFTNNIATSLLSAEDLSQSLTYQSSIVSLISRNNLEEHPIWAKHSSEEIIIDLKYSLKYQNLGIENVTIYSNNPDIPESEIFYQTNRLYGLPFYQNFKENQRNYDVYYLPPKEAIDYYNAKNSSAVITDGVVLFIREIQNDSFNHYNGILILEAEPQYFFSSLYAYTCKENGYLIYFHNMNQTYGAKLSKSTQKHLKNNVTSKSSMSPSNVLSTQKIDPYSITLVAQTPLKTNAYILPAIRLSLFLILMTFIQLIIFNLFIKKTFHRINQNITDMDEIIANDFAGKIIIYSEDEVGLIAQRYNLLLVKIDTLIIDLITKETNSKNAQIKALQYQINPHFIYNTLSIFAANAEQNGNDRLSEAISHMGHLLRYSVKDSGIYSTVSEELENAKSLIKVYSLRFVGSLSLKVIVLDEIMKCKLMRFLIQPIIENIIFHAHPQNNRDISIQVEFTYKCNFMLIKISDNGIGMTEERLRQVKQNIYYGMTLEENTSPYSSFIGLHNIYERLCLIYGEDADLEIQSIYQKGTDVFIKYPLLYEKT